MIRCLRSRGYFAALAQLVEQLFCKEKVPSSSLGSGSKEKNGLRRFFLLRNGRCRSLFLYRQQFLQLRFCFFQLFDTLESCVHFTINDQ